MAAPDTTALRRGLLAVSVLHGIELIPGDQGVRLRSPTRVRLGWAELAGALDGADPEAAQGRDRLARHVRARLRLAGGPEVQPRPYAIPSGHPLHPGPSWTRSTVPGGVLDLGLGIAGLDPADPTRVTPLPPFAGTWRGLAADDWEAPAWGYLREMAALAVSRRSRRPEDPLRPMGDCDVVTLLASAGYRAGLVAGPPAGRGMRTAAVPMRERGWLDLRRVDPEFVAVAAAATDPDRRGFPRPLLVTADELLLAGTTYRYSLPSAASRAPAGPPRPARRS